MVISPKFRFGQYRDNHHRENAPHFILLKLFQVNSQWFQDFSAGLQWIEGVEYHDQLDHKPKLSILQSSKRVVLWFRPQKTDFGQTWSSSAASGFPHNMRLRTFVCLFWTESDTFAIFEPLRKYDFKIEKKKLGKIYGIANYPFIEFKLQKLNLSLIKTEKSLKIICGSNFLFSNIF